MAASLWESAGRPPLHGRLPLARSTAWSAARTSLQLALAERGCYTRFRSPHALWDVLHATPVPPSPPGPTSWPITLSMTSHTPPTLTARSSLALSQPGTRGGSFVPTRQRPAPSVTLSSAALSSATLSFSKKPTGRNRPTPSGRHFSPLPVLQQRTPGLAPKAALKEAWPFWSRTPTRSRTSASLCQGAPLKWTSVYALVTPIH